VRIGLTFIVLAVDRAYISARNAMTRSRTPVSRDAMTAVGTRRRGHGNIVYPEFVQVQPCLRYHAPSILLPSSGWRD